MSCRGCIYRRTVSGGNCPTCDYILITGHSRGCPVEGRTKKETKGQARRRRDRPVNLPGSLPPKRISNRTAHKSRANRPGPQKLNEAAALELYRQGMSDAKIAAELGNVTASCIKMWRKRRGFPANWIGGRAVGAKKKAACEEAQTAGT